MSPREFAHYLNGLSLIRAKQDPDVRYKIAYWKTYSRDNFRVYRNWMNEQLGLEDLYQDLLAQEAGQLQIPYGKLVPDQQLSPSGY
jgi:hypothetical protein